MSSTDTDRHQSDDRPGEGYVWCPRCGAPLADSEAAIVAVCPVCAAQVDWDTAIRRSRAWVALTVAQAEHRRAEDALTLAEARLATARHEAASASIARNRAETAWRALNPPRRGASRLPATPSSPGAPLGPSPTTPRHRSAIPLAVLLQGTGAVLLLAALTTASAVLWEAMPEALQVLTLLAAVALVGAVTVMARPLPATSVVLAVLTTASGVVVAASLPQILPELGALWYPPVASAIGAACLFAAGRLGRVSFWWHTGWIGGGLTGVLGAVAVMDGSSLEAGTTPWFALASALFAAVAVALLAAAATLHAREAEAAATSWWTAMTVALLAVALGIAAIGRWAADLAMALAQDTAWVAADLLGLAALSYVAFLAAWLTNRSVAPGFLSGCSAFLAVLPSLALGVLPGASAWSAVIAVVPTAVAAAVLVWAGRRWRRHPWLLPAISTAAAVLVGSALLITALVLGQSPPPSFAWLAATLTALTVALAMWTYGVVLNNAVWAGAGLFLGTIAWFTPWANGHIGGGVEVVTLSVLAALLGSWWLGLRLDLWRLRRAPAVLPQVAVLVCLLPTAVVSLAALADGSLDRPRALLLGAGLGAVATLAWRQHTGATLPAAAVGVVGVAHAWVAVTERVPDPPLEWYSLSTAVAVALVVLAGVADGWTTPRAGSVAVLIVAFVPSAVALLVDPDWGTLTAGRLALVVAIGGLATALAWPWPVVAWATATLGLAAALRVYGDWAWPTVQPPGEGWAPLEVITLPAAVVLGASAALVSRAWDPRRAVSIGTTVAAGAAALPTLLLVADDPLVEEWDTAVRVLVLLAAAGLLAVLLDAVAPIRSGVAATGLVILPLGLYGAWLDGRSGVELEAVTVPLALAAALTLGWMRRPATPAQWWSLAARPSAVGLLLASTVWAIVAPAVATGAVTWLRMTVVAGVWVVAAVVMRHRAAVAAGSGAVAVLVVWANVLSAVAGVADPALEAVTWPTAAALAAWSTLGAWATGRLHNSWLVAAPAVAVALIPTAAIAWQDGTVGWRVWFALIAGGLLVAVGARHEWAGFVYPGLASLALVTVPVLAQWAQDLPGWVPLSLVGLMLLAVGARLEAARRRSGQLRAWVAHLH